jgi:hypothetical protein
MTEVIQELGIELTLVKDVHGLGMIRTRTRYSGK